MVGTIIWAVVGTVAVLLWSRLDDAAQRTAKWTAKLLGSWFGLDNFAVCRLVNRCATPIACLGELVFWIEAWDWKHPALPAWSALVMSSLILARWFSFEPRKITEVERERFAEAVNGARNASLWAWCRRWRAITIFVAFIWVCPRSGFVHVNFPSFLGLQDWLHVAMWFGSYLVVLFLSIDQPPFQHVSVRERLAVLKMRLTEVRA